MCWQNEVLAAKNIIELEKGHHFLYDHSCVMELELFFIQINDDRDN